MSFIGIALNIIYLGYLIFLINTFGMDTVSNQEELQKALQEWLNS